MNVGEYRCLDPVLPDHKQIAWFLSNCHDFWVSVHVSQAGTKLQCSQGWPWTSDPSASHFQVLDWVRVVLAVEVRAYFVYARQALCNWATDHPKNGKFLRVGKIFWPFRVFSPFCLFVLFCFCSPWGQTYKRYLTTAHPCVKLMPYCRLSLPNCYIVVKTKCNHNTGS